MNNSSNGRFRHELLWNTDDKVLDASQFKALADLPSKEQLLGQLLSVLQAPIRNLFGVLKAPARDLVLVLRAASEKKVS